MGQLVAQYLGWQCVDIDQLIAQKYDKPVSSVFNDEGEAAFRHSEKMILEDACSRASTVVCTGGGAILDANNRQLMMKDSLVVCLEALPETIYDRLKTSRSDKTREIRPVLEGSNTLSKIRRLKTKRQIFYAHSHWTIHTDKLTVSETALEVIKAWHLIKTKNAYTTNDPSLAAIVPHSKGIYPIFAGPGILDDLGKRLDELGIDQKAYIITDENTVHQYARKAQAILQRDGIAAHIYSIPPGEGSKTLDMAQHIYHWLTSQKAERKNPILAIGGGVVGDLAGYVAATFLRGMPFIQVPTSLTSMVDASIGGKVAINLPDGKNLIGAFYQPSVVLADTTSLSTLGNREVNEGWAEAIKHGLILDKSLFELFEDKADDLINLEETITTKMIRLSIKIKAQIVAEDERETLDRRILLNYGHTIGHALETVTKYNQLLHGEAVSIGMMGAAIISRNMNMLEESSMKRQQDVLGKFSLPTHASGISPEKIAHSMLRDKKMDSGTLKWVLLKEIGDAIVNKNVPEDIVNQALQTITA